MAQHVVVHVGTMKSGSSYLQAFFNNNVDRLAERGVLWPMAATCFRALGDLLGKADDRPKWRGCWSELATRLHNHRGPALLSNETIGELGADRRATLVAALETDDIQLVITARDLLRVVPSQWQTAVRSQGTRTWREYVEAVCSGEPNPVSRKFWGRHNVAAMVRRWSQQVPLERISVVTVPPPGNDPVLLAERFGTASGLDLSGLQPPRHYRNVSFGASSAELLRRMNQRTGEVDRQHYRLGFKDGLSRIALAGQARREAAIAMTPQQRQFVRRRAERIIEAIDATGVRVVGDLADLVSPELPARPGADPGETSDADLLEAALAGLVSAGRFYAEERIEHDLLIRTLHQALGDVVGRPPQPLSDDEDDDGSEVGDRRLRDSQELRRRLSEAGAY